MIWIPPPASGVQNIGNETVKFISKKVKKLFPYYTYALLINFIVWNIPFNGISKKTIERAISGLLNYVLAYSAGFRNGDFFYLGYSWYISAMIIAMFIIFPLIRLKGEIFYCIYAPLISILGMGLFAFLYRQLGYVSSENWILSNGVLRASFGLCIGCLSNIMSKKIESTNFTKLGENILSIILIITTALTTYRVVFLRSNYIFDFLIIYMFAIMISIAFSKKCTIYFELSHSVAIFLENLSYAIYITSNCWSYLIARIYPNIEYQSAVKLYVILVVICSISCIIICDLISKINIKKKIVNILVY